MDMRYLAASLMLVSAISPATSHLPVVTDVQSIEQLVDSLNDVLASADVFMLIELYWIPAWDYLSEEEVAAAREEAAASISAEELRAAQAIGDMPLSMQLVEFTITSDDRGDVVLILHFGEGESERETREAVWREGGWRLLSDHI